jgi:hypothetical protein
MALITEHEPVLVFTPKPRRLIKAAAAETGKPHPADFSLSIFVRTGPKNMERGRSRLDTMSNINIMKEGPATKRIKKGSVCKMQARSKNGNEK